jgi:hypothetical protein
MEVIFLESRSILSHLGCRVVVCVLDLNEPEVDCLLYQWGGFVPNWGPRGALVQYLPGGTD